MSEDLMDALIKLDEEQVVRLTQRALDDGTDPAQILAWCQKGITKVGELFEAREYFLSELIYSGAIFKKVSDLLNNFVKDRHGELQREIKAKVVIGTGAGDIHDIGKNIVVMLLQNADYQVFDLGVDVAPERFIEKVKETGAEIVGISALLTTSFSSMKEVIALLEKEGLRQSVHVMIGGGVVDESCRRFVGADAQSQNGYDAVRFCEKFRSSLSK